MVFVFYLLDYFGTAASLGLVVVSATAVYEVQGSIPRSSKLLTLSKNHNFSDKTEPKSVRLEEWHVCIRFAT